MSELGEMLAALQRPPASFRTVRGTLTKRVDEAARLGAIDGLMNANGAMAAMSQVVIYAAGEEAEPGPPTVPFAPEALRVWYEVPDRLRLETGDDDILVIDGATRWHQHGAIAMEVAEGPEGVQSMVDALLMPGRLPGLFALAIESDEVVAGRPCWTVTGSLRGRIDLGGPGMAFGGPEIRSWVDKATGVLLAHQCLVDGSAWSSMRFDEVVFDEAIDPTIFQYIPPPGVTAMTRADMMRQAIEQVGDAWSPQFLEMAYGASFPSTEVLSTVRNPDDSDQAEPATGFSFAPMMGMGPFGTGAPLDALIAMHEPVGPPPIDESDALIDIGRAFELIFVRGEGEALPTVQGGERFAPVVDEIMATIHPRPSDDRLVSVDHVMFLRADEAVVWFTLTPFHGAPFRFGPTEGRAVVVDGEWKVSRATFCQLAHRFGAVCPPR